MNGNQTNKKTQSKKKNRILRLIFGTLITAAGIAYLGNYMKWWSGFTVFFDGWWTLFIIIPCFVSIISKGLRKANALPFAAALFVMLCGLADIHITLGLVAAAAAAAAGVAIILKSRIFSEKKLILHDGTSMGLPYYSPLAGNGFFKVESEAFCGCFARSLFGTLSIDISRASLGGETPVDIDAKYGTVCLKLPPGSSVVLNVSGNQKKIYCAVPGPDENSCSSVIYVTGRCGYGKIQII